MEPCLLSDLENSLDGLVAECAPALGIDPICSTSHWTMPAAAAFAAASEPRSFLGDAGAVSLLEHEHPSGPVLTGLDCTWGFGAPFAGPDPRRLVDDLMRALRKLDYHALSIPGIDPAGPLMPVLRAHRPAGFTSTAERCVADVSAGFDAWLGRRSPRFRRSLRVAVARGETEGVRIEHIAPDGSAQTIAALARVLDVEKRSWKTGADSGLIDTSLGFFTMTMAKRFAALGALRIAFAQLDGTDIGYVIGGRIGDRYRGFQHSFDRNYPDLSVGKLLQFHNIAQLCAEGVATYDMGMHMDYKESYIDRIEATITMVYPGR